MKNKKGFTLVELLAVIAILALLTGIAVPNIISTINNQNRSTFLVEATNMTATAEYLVASNKTDRDNIRAGGTKIYTFQDLNYKKEYQEDVDGGVYDNNTYVKVRYADSSYKFCICVMGSKRYISKTTTCTPSVASDSECYDSSELKGIEVVKSR